MIPLVLIATAFGLIAAFLFRRLVNGEELRCTVNRILAHLIAFRLFVDEPMLVLRGQRDLLLENVRLLRLVGKPLLAAGILFAICYGKMDSHFGRRPLHIGESAVVTLPFGQRPGASSAFIIETPPVHIVRLHQTSWRIRVIRESSQFTAPVKTPELPWPAWFLIISTASGALVAKLSR